MTFKPGILTTLRWHLFTRPNLRAIARARLGAWAVLSILGIVIHSLGGLALSAARASTWSWR